MRFRLMQTFLFAVFGMLIVPQASEQLGQLNAALNPHAANIVSCNASAQDKNKEKDKEKEKHKDDDGDRRDYDESDYTEKDEVRQSYQLTPGAAVKVSGINGSVEVETIGGSTAEVYIVRSARRRADLDHRKVIVEHATDASLIVRGENERERRGSNDNHVQVRQRITLRLPRHIDFTASGINGRTIIGEVEGPVRVSGINGKVEVAQAVGYSELSGINGSVTVTISQLGERGLRVSGINGAVELRFADVLNADLKVTGINGAVTADVPNVTLEGTISRSNFNARIGTGGTPINISGVNGRVHLSPRS